MQSHWKADTAVSACEHCSAMFSLFKRRHHCRECGGIFCGACSQGRKLFVRTPNRHTAGVSAAERVCTNCKHNALVKSLRWDEEDGASGANRMDVTLYTMDASMKLVVNVDRRLKVQQLVAAVAERTRSEALAADLWYDLFVRGSEERLEADAVLGSLASDDPGGGSVALFLLPRSSPPPVLLTVQLDALLAFFRATGGLGWTSPWGWGKHAHFVQWYGVTAVGSGRVVRLDLSFNNLAGSIPSEIGQLAGLQQLNLRGNRLAGELPAEIWQLPALQRLDVHNNQFAGAIPSEIGQLSALQQLDLGQNRLTGIFLNCCSCFFFTGGGCNSPRRSTTLKLSPHFHIHTSTSSQVNFPTSWAS